jgi:hypothetical protein
MAKQTILNLKNTVTGETFTVTGLQKALRTLKGQLPNEF